MTSERLSLVVRSEADVQITIYDANGLKQVVGTKQLAASLPRGLYRLHLDRCSFGCDHLILHDAAEEIVLHAPRVESPAPIEIASGSHGHAELARRLSARDTAQETVLGTGRPDARLFVFVRRVGIGGAAFVPSEPVSIHDITGRELIEIAPGKAKYSGDPDAGYLGSPAGSLQGRIGSASAARGEILRSRSRLVALRTCFSPTMGRYRCVRRACTCRASTRSSIRADTSLAPWRACCGHCTSRVESCL